MASPYQVRLQFYLEDTEDELFHELDGTEYVIRIDDVIYLNDVGYKVEEVKLYLYDNQYVNPETGGNEWAMFEEYYKVYLSALPT